MGHKEIHQNKYFHQLKISTSYISIVLVIPITFMQEDYAYSTENVIPRSTHMNYDQGGKTPYRFDLVYGHTLDIISRAWLFASWIMTCMHCNVLVLF